MPGTPRANQRTWKHTSITEEEHLMPAPTPPAAWYPDPQVPGQLRWWGGQAWTVHTHLQAPTGAQAAAGSSVGAGVRAEARHATAWQPDASSVAPQHSAPAIDGTEQQSVATVGFRGSDGTARINGDDVLVEFGSGLGVHAVKKAIGVRRIPLGAIVDVLVEPAGAIRKGCLRFVLRDGADTLRSLLDEQSRDGGRDPDAVEFDKAGLEAAQAFAATVRARASDTPDPGPACVTSWRLPMTYGAADATVTFDGHTVVMTFDRMGTKTEKKAWGQRRIPVAAVLDVQIKHPRLTGFVRFVTSDGVGQGAPSAEHDPNAFVLHADSSRAYALLAAAIPAGHPTSRGGGISLTEWGSPRGWGAQGPSRTRSSPPGHSGRARKPLKRTESRRSRRSSLRPDTCHRLPPAPRGCSTRVP
jgi:hypothetical protein